MISVVLMIALALAMPTLSKPGHGMHSAKEESAEKCRQEASITKEWLTDHYSGKFQDEPDHSSKCYFKCLMEEFKMLGENGEIKIHHNQPGHFSDCLEEIKETTDGDDLCDLAYRFDKCIHMKHPGLPIF